GGALLVQHGRVESRFAEGREQAELALVFQCDLAQRAEPIEEAREVRHPCRVRANAGRGGIEERSGLRTRHAVRDQREGAANKRSIHSSFSPPVNGRGERSERARPWLA